MSVIEGLSNLTCKNYYQDIILFLRFVLESRELLITKFECEDNSKEDYSKITSELFPLVTDELIQSITKDDVMNFLFKLQSKGNDTPARNRRLSAIKKFFHYCEVELNLIENNPAINISTSRQEKKLPKYLSLEESNRLLDSVKGDKNYERNYCIITFFLNCGLRLQELIDINVDDIRDDSLRIMGKGSKERILHLNSACMAALQAYMKVRYSNVYSVQDKNALFISSTTGKRLSRRMVEKMINNTLKTAGLGGKGYSPHKLRHTAATLMYQYGNVDVLVLKDVLGHENLDTTKIYTHTNNKQAREATEKNPLANRK